MAFFDAGATSDSSEEDEPLILLQDNENANEEMESTTPMDEMIDDTNQLDNETSDQNESNDDAMVETSSDSTYQGIPLNNKSVKFKRGLHLIEKDEWGTDGWTLLMNETQRLPIAEARPVYQMFFDKFPMAGRWWKTFAEHELHEKNLSEVQNILKKALLEIGCPNVELWKFYLNFTKATKVDTLEEVADSEAGKAARKLMCDAYELALDRVGGSIHSNHIWTAYINFLKEDKDPQAFTSVRRAYQHAVCIPMHNMDPLWKEYEAFEKSLPNNENLAQSFMKLFKPKFDAARAVFRDRKAIWDGLNPNLLAVPPKKDTPDDTQVARWQKLIDFEIQNPERLDAAGLKSRVRFAFEQSLSCKRYNPELWYKYSIYEYESGDVEAAIAVYQRGTTALPDCYLLHFAFADFYASINKIQEGKMIFEDLLQRIPSPLVYIMYQKFVRRSFSGTQSLDEARNVFKLARKDDREGAFSYHVFVAAAMMEFYSDPSDSGKGIALKIFELGLKKFIQEPGFVLAYLDFLGQLNDDNNMRSLFEKVLNVMPPEKSRDIWDRFLLFESSMSSSGGDLDIVSRLEARKAQAYPDASSESKHGLLRIAHRYQFLNLKPDSESDQTYFGTYDEETKLQQLVSSAGKEAVESSAVSTVLERPKGPTIPDFLVELISIIPSGDVYNVPVPDASYMIRTLVEACLPPRSFYEEKELIASASKKRGRADTEENVVAPVAVNKRPVHDVFRSRQQQKLAKLQR